MSTPLHELVRSGHPVISIESTDEGRGIEAVRECATRLNRSLLDWSMTTGLRKLLPFRDSETVGKSEQFGITLRHLIENEHGGLILLRDAGPHLKEARNHRTLRDLIPVCLEHGTCLVLLDGSPLPDETRRLAIRYDLPWPTVGELDEVVRETFRRIQSSESMEITARIRKSDVEHLVQTLRGLTREEAARLVAAAIYDDYALTGDDLPGIIEAKRMLLGSRGCLEAVAADFEMEDLGGLDNLKAWLHRRRDGMGEKARAFGIDPPRGVLMLGVPGSGKSLCAKAVAADWRMPLLRLDPGNLYQKFIGESESQLRRALDQAEAMAPCILWVDEIEKAFASAAAQSADGGLSKRMFGTLLSWMQDHRHPIFLVATANDISSLPPELMRKGRFDEVFFIDLPEPDARRQVFAIHLTRKNRDPSTFDLDRLTEASEGFTGSEIEQTIRSALLAAFHEGSELTTDHVAEELANTEPLSTTMREEIRELREWARDRCVRA